MSTAPEVTEEVGGAIVRAAGAGATIHLLGEVGAGKTTLVRGAARALGIRGPVTSPTFEIARTYSGERPLVHVDAYRLESAGPEDEGLVASGATSEAITFVEWPGAASGALGEPQLVVELEHLAPERRLVRFHTEDPVLAARLAAALEDIRARHRLPEPEPGGSRGG